MAVRRLLGPSPPSPPSPGPGCTAHIDELQLPKVLHRVDGAVATGQERVDVVLQPQGVQPGGHRWGAVPVTAQSLHLWGKEGAGRAAQHSGTTETQASSHSHTRSTAGVGTGQLWVPGPPQPRVPPSDSPFYGGSGLRTPSGDHHNMRGLGKVAPSVKLGGGRVCRRPPAVSEGVTSWWDKKTL